MLRVTTPTLTSYCQATLPFELHTWQRDYLCPALEAIAKGGKGKRLAIHAPPQFGKSVIVSNRLITWWLGCNPLAEISLATYNQNHSAEFGDSIKRVLNSDEHLALFAPSGVKVDDSSFKFQTAEMKRLNTSHMSFRAIGFSGSGITGAGPNLFIGDDPYKSAEEANSAVINDKIWRIWENTIASRLDDDDNAIMMFHRYHDDDIAGRLLQDSRWEYLRFPALADENEDGSDPTGREFGETLSPMRSLEWLEDIKERNESLFYGQFQGVPRAPEGTFFKESDFQYIALADLPYISNWVRGWDLAVAAKDKSDFNASALVGMDADQNIYIRDVQNIKCQFPDLIVNLLETAALDLQVTSCNQIAIEKKDAGLSAIQTLSRLPGASAYAIHGVDVTLDKKSRAQVWASRGRLGKLFLVRGGWNRMFVNQCKSFRGFGVGHDDMVDAVSAAVQQVVFGVGGGTLKREPAYGTWEWQLKYQRSLNK